MTNLDSNSLHPDKVLLNHSKAASILAGCEHIAGTERFIAKALGIQQKLNGAFDITCDLEDGIAVDGVSQAVDVVLAALHSVENKFNQVGVRLLPFRHREWMSTTTRLIEKAGEKIAYLTLPKITRHFELAYIATCLKTIGQRAGISRAIPLHILVETQSLLADLSQLASHPDVQTLDFGIMDFVADHAGAIDISKIHSPAQFENRLLASAKLKIVQAALAGGIVPCHNVTVNYADAEATFLDAERAHSEFGFLRMWSIHPNQIEPIIKAMRPGMHAIEQASEILLAAYGKSWAPIGFEGILYDRASYRSLWQQLKRAKKNGVSLPDRCEQLFFKS